MSSDFYFKLWRTLLKRLETVLKTDIDYQTERSHDKHLADAVYRLIVVLGRYIVIYNEAVECLHNNLQVQKTEYMENIVKAIVSRIIELKRDLQEMEGTPYQFFGNGLISYKYTTDDIEMTRIPANPKRLPSVQAAIENAFKKAREIEKALAEPEVIEEIDEVLKNPFDMASSSDSDISQKTEDEYVLSPEECLRRDLLAMIMAHEKLRQVTRSIAYNKLRREAWEKELLGTAQPPARYELRVKSAKLIQRVFRVYFNIKRERITNDKLDKLLGFDYCTPPNTEIFEIEEQGLKERILLYEKYESECNLEKEKLKSKFIIRKGKEVAEDYRDRIREWFYEWFDSIQFIHDIPNPGCIAVLKDEAPDPHEWLEEYKELMKQKAEAKGKTPQQLKFEAKEKKKLEQMAKREEQKQKKADAALLKKMMKHPTMHPGYRYPQSKKTYHLVEAIKSYHLVWDSWDIKEMPEVKEKCMEEKNQDDAYKDAKMEILKEIEEDMDEEHRTLKQALREDYKNNQEVMPIQATKRKKPRKIKAIRSEMIIDKIQELALQGWVVDYPKTKLRDYIGDPNFVGEDLRRLILPADAHSFEVRAQWWEKCHTVTHRCNKILLVGPDGSGKIKLVHALASINNAILFQVDPTNVSKDLLTPEYMKTLIKNIASSARGVQPSVIHIRHVQKLFYAKVPPEETDLRLDLLKKYFVNQLLKRIRKQDKITIIGTCSDPWLARSNQLVKKFPMVILLPNTSYSVVVQLLQEWATKYNSIPCDFDVTGLAHVLQGYNFGYLQDMLDKFMSAERIVKSAAYCLTPMEVYNFILQDESTKTDYERYLKWYWEKTPSGKKEKQHIDDMIEYKANVAEFEAKEAKKAKQAKKKAAAAAAAQIS